MHTDTEVKSLGVTQGWGRLKRVDTERLLHHRMTELGQKEAEKKIHTGV